MAVITQLHVIVSPTYTGALNRKFITEASHPICPPISVTRLAANRPWQIGAEKFRAFAKRASK
jgi:hypothetical protein